MPQYVKEFFSQPHKCYVNIMNSIINILEHTDNTDNTDNNKNRQITVMGKAHITGGGFVDNIERILPVDVTSKLHIKLDKWELKNEWQWVFDNSYMEWDEFVRVFNAGWGFCFITDKIIDSLILDKICNEQKENIKLLGHIL
jgi:phosphoribosylformylglycinamidine cyclo-ligase